MKLLVIIQRKIIIDEVNNNIIRKPCGVENIGEGKEDVIVQHMQGSRLINTCIYRKSETEKAKGRPSKGWKNSWTLPSQNVW